MKRTLTVDCKEIDQAWRALTRQRIVNAPLPESRAGKMAEEGWVAFHEIRDALPLMESRLNMTWLSDLPEITERIGLHTEANFPRVWKYADEIFGDDRLSSSNALRYFWWLERLGFPIDTGSFCEAIIQTLPSTRHLSESNLDVLLYESERYSQPPIELYAAEMEGADIARTKTLTAENGVSVEIRYDRDDRPISLISIPPAFVAPVEHVSVSCETCGMTYMKGLKRDDDEHTICHRKALEPLEPRPSRAWRAAVKMDPEAVWVDHRSPKWMHIAMYRRARAFKREFGYDFVQWSDHPHGNQGGIAFAFLDENYRMVGGCRFQIGGGKDDCNRLHWIWFCPDARRKGHLTQAWARLRARMGDFDLEPPVSNAMKAFMTSRSD